MHWTEKEKWIRLPVANLPKSYRKWVRARMGEKVCAWCGSEEEITTDHILPRSEGGTHAIRNLRYLCRSCHNERHKEKHETLPAFV